MPATFKVNDRIFETSTTVGTGAYGLLGAQTGFQAWSVIGTGNLAPYFATDDINWEVGIGTWTSGPSTLARTTILASSNGGAAVNWGGGITQKIRCGLPAAMGMPRVKTKSVAGAADVTLTEEEQRCDILILTGVLTGSINVLVSATPWRWVIYNSTTGAFTATVKVSGLTGVAVTQTKRAVLYCDGTDVFSAMTDVSAAPAGNTPPRGRVTLTTGVPVTTTDVTAATTVYYTPYNGNTIPIYNGSAFVDQTFAETSQATSDGTKSPASVAASKVYDLFAWMDGATFRVTRGPAWTNDTTRGTGAGTSELQMINGINTNKVAITNGPGANLGTYVGLIRSDGSAQINDTITLRHVWNAYNRVIRRGRNKYSANRTTTSASYVEINSEIQISFARGLAEDAVWAGGIGAKNSAGNAVYNSVAFDGTTAEPGISCMNTLNLQSLNFSGYKHDLAVGVHYATLIGAVSAGTGTWLQTDAVGTDGLAAYLEVAYPG